MATKRKQAIGKRRRVTGVEAASAAAPAPPVEEDSSAPTPDQPVEQIPSAGAEERPLERPPLTAAPPTRRAPAPTGTPGVIVTQEGMIEERAWHAPSIRERRPEEKSLQELIASVMTVPAQEPPGDPLHEWAPAEAPEAEAAPAAAAVVPPQARDDPEARENAARRRLKIIAYLGVLAFVLFAGVFLFFMADGGSGDDPDPGAAQPAEVPAPVDGAAAPPQDGQVAAQPPPAAEPAPAVAPVETPTPAPPPPEPAAPPPPPPPTAPPPPPATPVPPPPPPPAIHVADLDGGTPGDRVLVRIQVHDAAHNPVAGATVTGLWTGVYSGPASCVTDATGLCRVRTEDLAVQGSVTFTATSVAMGNAVYDMGSNHDPDGDSDGTSVTITA